VISFRLSLFAYNFNDFWRPLVSAMKRCVSIRLRVIQYSRAVNLTALNPMLMTRINIINIRSLVWSRIANTPLVHCIGLASLNFIS